LTRLNVVFVEDQTDTQQHCHYLPLPHTQEATYLIQIFYQFQWVSSAAVFKLRIEYCDVNGRAGVGGPGWLREQRGKGVESLKLDGVARAACWPLAAAAALPLM